MAVVADLDAIVAAKYKPGSAAYRARNAGFYAGEPSRLGGAVYVAHTNDTHIVKVAGGTTIVKAFQGKRSDARLQLEIMREIRFGALHAGVYVLPGVTTVIDFWTLPAPVPVNAVLSPLRRMPTDWTIAMPPATARRARLEHINQFYEAKRARYPRGVPEKYADIYTSVVGVANPSDANVDRVYDGIVRGTISDKTVFIASEQPFVPGTTLHAALRQTTWPNQARLLRMLAELLVGLQAAAHFQHGDLSPNNIMVAPDGQTLQLIDVGRASSMRVPELAPSTERMVETFDLRFFGVWLAFGLFAGHYAATQELCLLTAALVMPSRALIDLAAIRPEMVCLDAYTFHGPRHEQLSDYVTALITVVQALTTAPVSKSRAMRTECSNLMWDVGPWTRHFVTVNQLSAATYPTDLANPTQMLRFDILNT